MGGTMKRSIRISIIAILALSSLQIHTHYHMSKITLHNKSYNYTITLPTHKGNITVAAGGKQDAEIQRGQSYEITASTILTDRKATPIIVGRANARFTQGDYDVTAEQDPANPNSVVVIVAKSSKKGYYPRY